jgi:penicillin-binding protein 1B
MAAKTGTTNELRDSWFTGLDNNELVSIWVGRDDNTPAGLTGASGALQLFSGYMSQRGVNSLAMNMPEGVSWANFSRSSGTRVTSDCPAVCSAGQAGRAGRAHAAPARCPARPMRWTTGSTVSSTDRGGQPRLPALPGVP